MKLLERGYGERQQKDKLDPTEVKFEVLERSSVESEVHQSSDEYQLGNRGRGRPNIPT